MDFPPKINRGFWINIPHEADFLHEDTPAIAESYLRRSLEAIFDIGRHIIAKSAEKGIVEYSASELLHQSPF
ncbi:MAG: hypothetical protein DRP81_05315 [Candidatus Omnitrophota bacterium]|nr:MAG: hypothetical protein DRP81_05315 [Candidatus Omnitrophota bacterium]